MRHLISDWALGPSADFEVNLELDLINTSTHIVPSVYTPLTVCYTDQRCFCPILALAIMCWNYQWLFHNQPRGVCSRRNPCRHHLPLSGIMLPVHGTLGDRDRMIDQWVDDTIRSFVANSQCLPQVFNVTPLPDGNFELSAGLAHGLSAGSWIVVASRNLMIGNEVSDATFDSLSIMRVSASNSYSAIAEPLASSIGQSNVRSGELTGMML